MTSESVEAIVPAVSVVIAATRSDLLPEALRAVAAQTFTGPMEVVVMHDGGEPFDLGNWPFAVRTFGIRPRSGPSAARNAAAALSRGALIAFCDDDDIWQADHLEATVPGAMASGGLVFTDALLQHVQEGWQAPFRFRFSPEVLRRTNPIILSSVVLSREAFWRVGGFDLSLTRYEAWDLFLRLAAVGVPLSRVPRPTITYRFSPRSTTADMAAMERAFRGFRLRHGLGELPVANFATMLVDPAFAALRDED